MSLDHWAMLNQFATDVSPGAKRTFIYLAVYLFGYFKFLEVKRVIVPQGKINTFVSPRKKPFIWINCRSKYKGNEKIKTLKNYITGRGPAEK